MLTDVSDGATTSFTYNADGSIATRTDGTFGTTNFTYDWAGRVSGITAPAGSPSLGSVGYTYRLDGALAGQTWSTGEAATLSYDRAKRATQIAYTHAGSISQTYDRVGNVTSDSRTLACATADACSNKVNYSYDSLRRVTAWSGLTVTGETYKYDLDSNRVTKTQGGVTWTYTYDRTDELVSESTGGTPVSYAYDPYGNLTSKAENDLSATTYAYDLSGTLTGVTPAGGPAATYTFDALGRLRTRKLSGVLDSTYRYVGTGQTVYSIVNPSATTTCFIGASGSRIATATGSAIGWSLFDLHGDIVAQESSGGSITDAFRYDAYGQTVATFSVVGGSGLLTSWRYQGRLDISPTSDPLYANGARLYSPSIGTFTQLDTVSGKATNPLSMNRFLYAEANPATLTDPSGHWTHHDDDRGTDSAGATSSTTSSSSGCWSIDGYDNCSGTGTDIGTDTGTDTGTGTGTGTGRLPTCNVSNNYCQDGGPTGSCQAV